MARRISHVVHSLSLSLMNGFLRVLSYIHPYKVPAIINIFLNILAVIFSLVSLVMVIPFLNILFDKQAPLLEKPTFSLSTEWITGSFNYYLSQIILQEGKLPALLFVCCTVILVFFLKNLFRYGALHFMAGIRSGVVRDIRANVFQKMLHLPISYFSKERKGDLTARLTTDIQQIEWSIMSFLEVTFREPITIIIYLASMLIISPQLTLFVLLVLPITGFIIGKIGKTLKKKSLQAQGKLGQLMTIIEESITGLRVIKGFNAQGQQFQRFQDINQAHYRLLKSMQRRNDLSSPLSEFLSICIVAIVLYFGGRLVLSETSTLQAETFIAFMVIFSQILSPAKSFSNAFYHIQKGIASVDRVASIIDAPTTIQDHPQATNIDTFQQQIQFKDVHFAYTPHIPTLSNINLTISKGSIIALVGASGAGKSTLADLLPRFYDATKGQILLDGQDIRQYKLQDLRQLMGIVTQQPLLFNDTIFNNIALGMEQVAEEAVIKAAKIANAHQFITLQENGYHTNIGDSGCKLSGGERQRLTIARAILQNPPILILDEATSSLDAASEKLVQEALLQLMKNRTSIVIAHRLSTIQSADEIIVLDKGQIVERGSHKSLILQENGIYRRLVALQAL